MLPKTSQRVVARLTADEIGEGVNIDAGLSSLAIEQEQVSALIHMRRTQLLARRSRWWSTITTKYELKHKGVMDLDSANATIIELYQKAEPSEDTL